MNKVVCNICGTTYPENATQCPICGYVQTADNSEAAIAGDGTYTYVKGGRFSKANVKKRNLTSGSESGVPAAVKKRPSGNKQSNQQNANVGTIILIVVLLIAILAVSGYIILRFFLPNDFLYEGLDNLKFGGDELQSVATEPVETLPPVTEPVEETTEPVKCTGIILDTELVELEGPGSTYQLMVSLEPVDFQDTVTYVTSDGSVATVDESGLITAVSAGTAMIDVSCGDVTVQCTVVCKEKPEILELNRKEITFTTEGENWLLYNGEIPIEDIIWTSDDNKVATIESGKVTAVGNGDTTVYGVFNDQTVACVIHCKFDEAKDDESNISEADGDSAKSYKLHNPYGLAEDVTISVGDQFILKLVDENMEEATDAVWEVKSESICTYSDSTVTAVGSGVTQITATCDGKTYTCVVRVN